MNTKPIKYFLYARKSSESEDRQITSIEDQISELQKLANHLNLEIVDIIAESKSAKEPEARKGFNEMLKRIEKGEARGIVCWKLNRLARNPIDGAKISYLLQNGVVQHIQTFEREYKSDDNVILMSLEFGLSNQYIKDLSVDVKRGCRRKAERGWYPATILPIGYIHNSHKNQERSVDEIIPNPKTFPIVKKLWDLLLTGLYSLSDIKREADALGLVSKKGRPLSMSNIHYLFSNEFYCGYFKWKDENGIPIRYLGKHKPMISQLQFLKVQEICKKNSNSTRKKEYIFPYRGLISCGECGGVVTAEHKLQVICTECKYKFSIKTKDTCPKCKMEVSKMKKPSMVDKIYYHCTKKVHKHCSQGSITESAIEEFIEENLKDITINQEFYDFAIHGLKKLNQEAELKENKVLIHLKKRKSELSSRIKGLIQMRAGGEITAEQFQEMQKENIVEIDKLEMNILSMEYQEVNWFKIAKEQLSFALLSLQKFKKGTEQVKKEIVSKLGSNLVLKDKSLYFTRLNELITIQKYFNEYSCEKHRLEPEISVGNKGDSNYFNTLFPILLKEVITKRTYQ